MSINKLTVTGRLTADPVLSQVGDSNSASFTLASDTRTKDAGGEYITNFYRCTAWRRLAEIAVQYLHKGDKVTIAGDLCLRPYVDKQSAQRLSVQVNVTDLELPAKVQAAHSSARPAADDDLPI